MAKRQLRNNPVFLDSLDATRGLGGKPIILVVVVNAVGIAVDDVFGGVTTGVVFVEVVVKTFPLDGDPVSIVFECVVAENAVSSSGFDCARDLGFHISRG